MHSYRAWVFEARNVLLEQKYFMVPGPKYCTLSDLPYDQFGSNHCSFYAPSRDCPLHPLASETSLCTTTVHHEISKLWIEEPYQKTFGRPHTTVSLSSNSVNQKPIVVDSHDTYSRTVIYDNGYTLRQGVGTLASYMLSSMFFKVCMIEVGQSMFSCYRLVSPHS